MPDTAVVPTTTPSPKSYTLETGGKSYTIHWAGKKPPSQDDFDRIVGQLRSKEYLPRAAEGAGADVAPTGTGLYKANQPTPQEQAVRTLKGQRVAQQTEEARPYSTSEKAFQGITRPLTYLDRLVSAGLSPYVGSSSPAVKEQLGKMSLSERMAHLSPGGFFSTLFPETEQVAAETPGALGGLRKAALGVSTPANAALTVATMGTSALGTGLTRAATEAAEMAQGARAASIAAETAGNSALAARLARLAETSAARAAKAAGGAKAIGNVGRLTSGAFSAQQAQAAVEAIQKIKEDPAKYATEAALNALFAGLAGRHAVASHPSPTDVPRGPVPSVTPPPMLEERAQSIGTPPPSVAPPSAPVPEAPVSPSGLSPSGSPLRAAVDALSRRGQIAPPEATGGFTASPSGEIRPATGSITPHVGPTLGPINLPPDVAQYRSSTPDYTGPKAGAKDSGLLPSGQRGPLYDILNAEGQVITTTDSPSVVSSAITKGYKWRKAIAPTEEANAVQERGAETPNARVGEGGEAVAKGGRGVRRGKQGNGTAGAGNAEAGKEIAPAEAAGLAPAAVPAESAAPAKAKVARVGGKKSGAVIAATAQPPASVNQVTPTSATAPPPATPASNAPLTSEEKKAIVKAGYTKTEVDLQTPASGRKIIEQYNEGYRWHAGKWRKTTPEDVESASSALKATGEKTARVKAGEDVQAVFGSDAPQGTEEKALARDKARLADLQGTQGAAGGKYVTVPAKPEWGTLQIKDDTDPSQVTLSNGARVGRGAIKPAEAPVATPVSTTDKAPAATPAAKPTPAPASPLSKLDQAVAGAKARLASGEAPDPSVIAKEHGLSLHGAEEAIREAYDEHFKDTKPAKPAPSVSKEIVPSKADPYEKAMDRLDSDPEAKKSQVMALAKKMYAEGAIDQAAFDYMQELSKDRDMGVEDMLPELRAAQESRAEEAPPAPSAKPSPLRKSKRSQAGYINLGVTPPEVKQWLLDQAHAALDYAKYLAHAVKEFGKQIVPIAKQVWQYAKLTARPGRSARLEVDAGVIGSELRDKLVQNLSHLHREARRSWVATVNYGTSRLQAFNETRLSVPKVLEHIKDAGDRERFQTYLVADRIYALLDSLKRDFADPATTPARKKEIQDHLAALWRPVDPVDGSTISSAKLRAYLSRPDVAKAIEAHKAIIEPLLKKSNLDYGFDPNGIRGKFSGAFTPAIVADPVTGDPLSPPGVTQGGFLKPKAKITKPDASMPFSGSADFYQPDYETAIGSRLTNAMASGNAAVMWKQLIKDGVAVERDKAREGDVAMKIEDKTGKKITGLPETVYVSRNIAPEINKVFDRQLQSEIDQAVQHGIGKLIHGQLWGISEAVYHGTATLGRTGQIIGFGKGFRNISPQTRTVAALWEIVRHSDKFTPDDLAETSRLMARYGVMKEGFPFKEQPGLLGKTQRGLYGERGIVTKQLAMIYQYGKKMGWSNAQIGEAMQQMNVHARFLQSAVQTNLQKVGLGTFYQTGMMNRVVGLRYGLGIGMAAGSILLYSALQRARDPEGKWWFERAGQHFGEFMVGKDDDGRPIYLGLWNWLNRPQSYAFKVPATVAEGVRDKQSARQLGLNTVASGVNLASGPVVNGPLSNLVQAANPTYIPQTIPNDQETGLKLMDNPSANTDIFSFDRLKHGVQTVMPITGFVGGADEAYRKSSIKSEYWSGLNRVMRMVGGPQMRAGLSPEAVEGMNAQRERKAEQMRLRASARAAER